MLFDTGNRIEQRPPGYFRRRDFRLLRPEFPVSQRINGHDMLRFAAADGLEHRDDGRPRRFPGDARFDVEPVRHARHRIDDGHARTAVRAIFLAPHAAFAVAEDAAGRALDDPIAVGERLVAFDHDLR